MSYFPQPEITFEAALRDLQSRNARARARAAHALGDVVDPGERQRATKALVEVLSDERPEVRAEAAFALGELAIEAAVPALSRGLEDPTPVVRQACAIALGKIGFGSGFEPLARVLREGPADVRFQAATSLAEVDPERAYQPLVAALSDDDAEVAGAAAVALGAVGDPRAAGHLAPLLEHHSRRTRLDAAYALAELGDERSTEVLVACAGDPELGWDAMEALEKLGDPAAADILAPLLDQPRVPPPLALHAASTVLALRPDHPRADRAREVLLAGLRLRKLDQRGLAVHLLGKVGGDWAVEPLRELRGRRGGRHLQEEIDEALERLAHSRP